MTILVVMADETAPLATVKARLSEFVDRVERYHERIVLTRNGRPAAVLISPDDLEVLEETLEVLSDPEVLARLVSEDRGRVASKEELVAKYLRR